MGAAFWAFLLVRVSSISFRSLVRFFGDLREICEGMVVWWFPLHFSPFLCPELSKWHVSLCFCIGGDRLVVGVGWAMFYSYRRISNAIPSGSEHSAVLNYLTRHTLVWFIRF